MEVVLFYGARLMALQALFNVVVVMQCNVYAYKISWNGTGGGRGQKSTSDIAAYPAHHTSLRLTQEAEDTGWQH